MSRTLPSFLIKDMEKQEKSEKRKYNKRKNDYDNDAIKLSVETFRLEEELLKSNEEKDTILREFHKLQHLYNKINKDYSKLLNNKENIDVSEKEKMSNKIDFLEKENKELKKENKELKKENEELINELDLNRNMKRMEIHEDEENDEELPNVEISCSFNDY